MIVKSEMSRPKFANLPSKSRKNKVTKQLVLVYDKLFSRYGARELVARGIEMGDYGGCDFDAEYFVVECGQGACQVKRGGFFGCGANAGDGSGAADGIGAFGGVYNQQTATIKGAGGAFVWRIWGRPANMRWRHLETQRAQLLALYGIGPETADAILLYVAEQPIFVIDAFTR